jgi:hypothetical protein
VCISFSTNITATVEKKLGFICLPVLKPTLPSSETPHTSGGAVNEPRTRRADKGKSRAAWWLLALAVIAGGFALPYFRRTHSAPAPAPESAAAPPPAVVPSEVNPWREAARLVEEDRGQAIGRAARVHVPAELRHYADKRRFLALQVAA